MGNKKVLEAVEECPQIMKRERGDSRTLEEQRGPPEVEQTVFCQHSTLVSRALSHLISLHPIKAFIRGVLLMAAVHYFVIFSFPG